MLNIKIQYAIKFVHKHENFRWKPLKGNGRGRIREGKERGPARILCPEALEFLATPLQSSVPAELYEGFGDVRCREGQNANYSQPKKARKKKLKQQ